MKFPWYLTTKKMSVFLSSVFSTSHYNWFMFFKGSQCTQHDIIHDCDPLAVYILNGPSWWIQKKKKKAHNKKQPPYLRSLRCLWEALLLSWVSYFRPLMVIDPFKQLLDHFLVHQNMGNVAKETVVVKSLGFSFCRAWVFEVISPLQIRRPRSLFFIC